MLFRSAIRQLQRLIAGEGFPFESSQHRFQRGATLRCEARGDLSPVQGREVLEFRWGKCPDHDGLLAKQVARRRTQQIAITSTTGLVAVSPNDNKGYAIELAGQ